MGRRLPLRPCSTMTLQRRGGRARSDLEHGRGGAPYCACGVRVRELEEEEEEAMPCRGCAAHGLRGLNQPASRPEEEEETSGGWRSMVVMMMGARRRRVAAAACALVQLERCWYRECIPPIDVQLIGVVITKRYVHHPLSPRGLVQ